MREAFDRELNRLQGEVLRMGSEVGENLVKVVNAFIQRDMLTSRLMIDADESINQRRIEVGLDSLRLIATQQPVAGDMRTIGSILEIVGELERIHDYVKGIGKISIEYGENLVLPELKTILPEMAEISAQMLSNSMKAFAERDTELALEIPAADDQVDELFTASYQVFVNHCIANPNDIHQANYLEWVSHNLERSADRAINICEWVIYMTTGVYKEMSMGEYSAPPRIG